MMNKTYYFYNLKNSPWPLISSIMAFNMMMSLLALSKFGCTDQLLLSIILIIYTSTLWGLEVKSETNKGGFSTHMLETSLKGFMIVFIVSEILFFFSMFWAYFHYFLSPNMELGMSWPPVQIMMFSYDSTPLLNTAILLTSAVTVTLAHKMLIHNNKLMYNILKIATLILSFSFTYLQFSEYKNSFFSMSDSNYGSIFFMLTGFHGVHVILGSMYLLANLLSSMKTNNTADSPSFEMAAWYWHFVDVVWLVVFYTLYYLNS